MDQDLTITVEALVHAPIEKVWEYYNDPIHITKWAFASDDWEAPRAENDLRTGGRFVTTMAAKDKSSKFDFSGIYTEVEEHKLIAYTMDGDDKRKVRTTFTQENGSVRVKTDFEMEHENTRELQQEGWQAILNNFKKHCETS